MDASEICITCIFLMFLSNLICDSMNTKVCFDKIPTEKCERKRKIGKCKSNPWRMMNVCNKTCYCNDYSLLQSGHDCQSDGVFIGQASSIKDCADICRKKQGCQYFMLDKRNDDEESNCFWKKMDDSSCSEGWNQDSHKNTYALKGPMGVKLLRFCDLNENEVFNSAQELLGGNEIKFNNATEFLYKGKIHEKTLRNVNNEIKRVSRMVDTESKDSEKSICARKDELNSDFQKCFSQDISNAQKFLHANFRMTNTCYFTYSSESKFDNCSLTKNLQLNTTISCRYGGMNKDQIVTWACLLELDSSNQNCRNEDHVGKPLWGKYFFMHTFLIYWTSGTLPLTSKKRNIIRLNKNPKATKPAIIVVIAVSCTIVFAVIIFLMIRSIHRRKVSISRDELSTSLPTNLQTGNEYIQVNNLMDRPPDEELDAMHEKCSIISSNECEDCQMISSLPSAFLKLPDMLYPRCSINIEEGIGFGNFGTVCKGSLRIGNARFAVAIKHPHAKTDGNFDTEEMQMFLEEAKSMLEIGEYHENIVNLQGVIYGHEDILKGLPMFSLMLEYCPKGNLRSYLLEHDRDFKRSLKHYHEKGYIAERKDFEETVVHDIKLLCAWGCQVANGMQFLSEKHIHHGDLAARNVLLTENLVVKISDFGLSRRLYQDLGESQDVLKHINDNKKIPLRLPMKWLALEVLLHQKIVPSKSDVWSYGVLLWEIFQLGAVPYRNGIDFEQLILELRFGVRLPPPQFCPFSIAELMKQCFHEDPYQRPSFEKLKQSLTQICSTLDKDSPAQFRKDIRNESDNTVVYADIRMRERYFKMKEKNKNLKALNRVCSKKLRYVKPFAFSCTYINEEHSIDSPSRSNTESDICKANPTSYSEPSFNRIEYNRQRQTQDKNSNKYDTYPGRNRTKSYAQMT